jgi:hypothetical protein
LVLNTVFRDIRHVQTFDIKERDWFKNIKSANQRLIKKVKLNVVSTSMQMGLEIKHSVGQIKNKWFMKFMQM